MATPTFRQMRTFLAVVEAGSVSAAARALNLTQPAASQQLRELERCLRVRLLDRAGGRSLPTAAGRALLEPARRVQAAIHDAVAVAAAHRAGETGRVRLGPAPRRASICCPPFWPPRVSAWSGLEVLHRHGQQRRHHPPGRTGELDLGLVTLPIASSRSLSVTRLMADPLLALIPEAMADGSETIGVAQLAALPLILYDPGGSTRALIDGWFRRAGVTPVPAMQLDSVESIKVLVSGGSARRSFRGWRCAIRSPATVTRRPRPALTRQLALVARREKVIDHGLRVVMDALRAIARDR